MNLKQLLQRTVKNNVAGVDNSLSKETEYFNEFYGKYKTVPEGKIPAFYSKVPKKNDVLLLKLREEARSNFLQAKNKLHLNNDELKELWSILHRHHNAVNGTEDILINYKHFVDVSSAVSSKFRQYFRPSTFAKLQQGDTKGRISVTSLFNYIMRKVWFHQTRLGLSVYDETGEGFLKESDLENYISELIPTLPQLGGLEKSFYNFYICTAVRKFMFFLDPMHTGRVRIQDIIASGFLDELLELRDEEASKEMQVSNWFSASSALRIYGDYLNLDRNHNGMLNKAELASYGTGTLTEVFINRVFQECLTYSGEMDYRTYLDFVLALENRQEPQSLHYLFKLLDIDNKGYLDTFSLNYFFKAIQDLMRSHGQEPISFQDVNDEIFDMVKPAEPGCITLKDLFNCEQGDTVVSILIDLNGFWNHENREIMAAENVLDNSK